MNVAVLEPFASSPRVSSARDQGPERAGHASEWIDPEGDDWFSEIYRELARELEPAGPADHQAIELDHWFG